MSDSRTPCNLVLIMLCDLTLPCGDEKELQTVPSFPVRVFKGGESSNQFRWFTIAKIEL